jgi:thiosulfate dehydrogenase [quinone] large subunit
MIRTTMRPDSPDFSTASRNGNAPLRRLGLPAGLAAVQLVLAYEWLLSGINKVLNPNFTLQLAATLQQNISGNPYGWYGALLRAIVLPHAGLFGVLTELGEVSIGLTLLGSALLWLRRPHSRLTIQAGKVACLALTGAVFLPLNFFFMSGDPVPWINPANAFNEGVSIDALIPLLSATLLVANLRAVRTTTRFAAQYLNREWMPWAS